MHDVLKTTPKVELYCLETRLRWTCWSGLPEVSLHSYVMMGFTAAG